MSEPIKHAIGGAWLVAHYGLALILPLTVTSRIGGRRSSETIDGLSTETYVPAMLPSSSWQGHLTFHLKHEAPHLELLSRLFEALSPQDLAGWIDAEPTGQYARRACFLYEWLTQRTITTQANVRGGYVDALDGSKMVVASAGREVMHKRWRVRDNLPGNGAFCPLVRKTSACQQAMATDVQALLAELATQFGHDLLMRSAVWMTLRESKSSFAIEGEGDQADRIQRFANVLARRTGEGSWPLDAASLADMQSDILGKRSTVQHFGLRQSPVFVGEVANYQEVVHYIAPPAADLAYMLQGLQLFLERTQGQSPVMRSAVAAFGFIYIHPLADGNGRVHRLLINDSLRRDGAITAPMVVPISALISRDATERHAYDRILENISMPMMRALRGLYAFTTTPTHYPDGMPSNFVMQGDAVARHAWRALDLTAHVSYLAHLLQRTISEDMQQESRYLRSHAQARLAIKDILEMPDNQADRVIRSVFANQGALSNALAKEIPVLAGDGVWDGIW